MGNPAAVSMAEGRKHLHRVIDNPIEGQAGLRSQLVQACAFDKLHHHDKLILELECGAQLRNVGMLEGGQCADFRHEPRRHFGLRRKAGKQNLDRILAVGDDIAHLEDATHAVCSEETQNLIIANQVPDLQAIVLPPIRTVAG